MDGWIWGGIGAALMIVEVMAPGYYLIFPAAGGLAVAVAATLGVGGMQGQLILFALVTGALFAAFYRWYRQLTAQGRPASVNMPDRLIGAVGTVEDPFIAGQGKIRLGDSVWLARGPLLPKGRPVTVTAVEGTVLVVAAGD
jgi:membrane protein implicated in regulation of membrane protease activity